MISGCWKFNGAKAVQTIEIHVSWAPHSGPEAPTGTSDMNYGGRFNITAVYTSFAIKDTRKGRGFQIADDN